MPREFRIVSRSLGATRWQTIRHQVLPHAVPGIITGITLGLSRAAGETAPILFTVAAFCLPDLPRSASDQTIEYMADAKKEKKVTATYGILQAAHHLDRVGDMVTNVAERVIYVATGSLEEIGPPED